MDHEFMIDNNILIQAFTTVLAGILIFVTLERHFIWKELFNENSEKMRRNREEVIEERLALEDKLHKHYLERRKNVGFKPSIENR
jgi:hypothetical protein